jgi:glyoxylase-like metal-dependent hydrolase (beta-lactamase superfamily II)
MALIVRTLHLGPLDNNTYILACPETREAALVDVGFQPEAVLEAVNREVWSVRALLNTHAHYDHICGMRAMQIAFPGAHYWLHPDDSPLLARLSEQGAAFGFPPAQPPLDPHPLADGQRLSIGRETLRVLHTPGHSPGHVCFFAGDIVWCGDVLFAGSVGRTDLPGGSWDDLERSIRTRLFPLGDAVRALPGHGPETTIGRERRDNPFVGEGARLA